MDDLRKKSILNNRVHKEPIYEYEDIVFGQKVKIKRYPDITGGYDVFTFLSGNVKPKGVNDGKSSLHWK